MKSKVYVINQDIASDVIVLLGLVFGLGFWAGTKWKAKKKEETEGS